jgi:hypothetical protein
MLHHDMQGLGLRLLSCVTVQQGVYSLKWGTKTLFLSDTPKTLRWGKSATIKISLASVPMVGVTACMHHAWA